MKRVGEFWAKPSDKFTTHLRVCDFRGEKIRVQIVDGISTKLADKVIALVAARKVRFGSKPGDLNVFEDEMRKMLWRRGSHVSTGNNPDGPTYDVNG